ncbi:MAG: hypothetical protein R2717_09075 [Schumannella sp.]
MSASTRSALSVVGAALVVAALTALVFVVRAGGDPADAATWPITWELRSSDNGTLFQVMQDAVAGRPLDWSFSPQVYVFPELPLSAIAFAISGGSIHLYYLVVAVLANVLLLLCLVLLARVLDPEAPVTSAVMRAGVAVVPLLVLPLIGTSWILSFHLAPTYYLGMYAALVAAPAVVLARGRPARITLGVALALTAASNPLALLFAAPGTAAALVLLVIRRGWRPAVRPAVTVGALLLGALVLRFAFSPLQGTSPFTYVDPEVFARRLAAIGPYYAYQARDPAAGVILVMGVVLAAACLAGAIWAAVAWLRRGPAPDRRLLVVVMLGTVPLGGLGATYLMMITHYYYFWPVLILPYALVLLALPRPVRPAALGAGAAALVVVLIATGLPTNLGGWGRYDGYRTPETVCLDDAVPGMIGYATFSDARRLSLPSATGSVSSRSSRTGRPTGGWRIARPRARTGAPSSTSIGWATSCPSTRRSSWSASVSPTAWNAATTPATC